MTFRTIPLFSDIPLALLGQINLFFIIPFIDSLSYCYLTHTSCCIYYVYLFEIYFTHVLGWA